MALNDREVSAKLCPSRDTVEFFQGRKTEIESLITVFILLSERSSIFLTTQAYHREDFILHFVRLELSHALGNLIM